MSSLDKIHQELRSHIEHYINKPKKFHYHPLDEALPKERKIKNVIAGLETSIGGTFWKKLTIKIARANDFKVLKLKKFHSIDVPLEVKEYIDKLVSLKDECINERDILDNINKLCDIKSNKMVKIKDSTKKSTVCFKKNGIKYYLIFKTVHPNSSQKKSNAELVLTKYIFNRMSKFKNSEFKCIIVYPYEVESSSKDKSFYIKYGKEYWDTIVGDAGTYEAIISSFKSLCDFAELHQYINNKVK